MDFSLSADQQRLREEIVAFARADLNDGAAERDRDHVFPRDLWLKCGERRLQGLFIPKEYGGRGLDPLSSTLALEALGYGSEDGGLSFSISQHSWVSTKSGASMARPSPLHFAKNYSSSPNPFEATATGSTSSVSGSARISAMLGSRRISGSGGSGAPSMSTSW